MEYKHGIRITPLLHELSPLEAAIQNYSNKAKDFYAKKASSPPIQNETKKERLAREHELALALKHLETERLMTETIVDVQAQIELYREQNRKRPGESREQTRNRISKLGKEKHHPTDLLSGYMRAVGRPKPSTKHTPHHIVPGKGRTKAVYRARIRLHALGIGINDPDNGVWLIRLKENKGHWSMPDSNSHLEIHTKNYEGWIERHINLTNTEQKARHKLKFLRLLLQNGTQPKNITMPPDENWKGL